jgi:hypothetical protein
MISEETQFSSEVESVKRIAFHATSTRRREDCGLGRANLNPGGDLQTEQRAVKRQI